MATLLAVRPCDCEHFTSEPHRAAWFDVEPTEEQSSEAFKVADHLFFWDPMKTC